MQRRKMQFCRRFGMPADFSVIPARLTESERILRPGSTASFSATDGSDASKPGCTAIRSFADLCRGSRSRFRRRCLRQRDDAPYRTFTADHGFTLIELLVSLAILALLMAMVPSTLRLGRRAWETPGQLDQASDAAAALAFAEHHVAGALPLFDPDPQGTPRIAFSGLPQSLSFVIPMSSGPYGGGLYRIEIGAATESAPSLHVSLYTSGNASGRATPLSEHRSLGNGFASLQFRYFGLPAMGEVARWQDQWPRHDRLPDLVEIIATPKAGSAKPQPPFRSELKLRPIS